MKKSASSNERFARWDKSEIIKVFSNPLSVVFLTVITLFSEVLIHIVLVVVLFSRQIQVNLV